jgi:putative transposase
MVDAVPKVWEVSISRAWQALRVERATYRYRSKRTGQAPLLKRILKTVETQVH